MLVHYLNQVAIKRSNIGLIDTSCSAAHPKANAKTKPDRMRAHANRIGVVGGTE